MGNFLKWTLHIYPSAVLQTLKQHRVITEGVHIEYVRREKGEHLYETRPAYPTDCRQRKRMDEYVMLVLN